MYRIELAPGEEALFRNIDELAKAIHSGVVGSHSRIWHGATNKWLPIDFHPHYKIAKDRPVAPATKPAAHAPVVPAPAPLPHSVFAPPAATAAPAPAVTLAPAPAPIPAPAPAAPSAPIAAAPPAPVPPTAAQPVKAPAQSVRTRELMFIELDPEPANAAPTPAQVSALLFPEPPPVEKATPKHIEALVAMARRVPVSSVEEPAEITIDISRPASRFSRRTVGAAAASLFVVVGIAGALMARRAPASTRGSEIPVASTSLAATPASSFELEASRPSAAPITLAPQRNAPAEPSAKAAADSAKPIIPAAPTLANSRAQLAIAESSLRDVSGEAESELEAKLRASGLGNLFAPGRLVPEQIGSARVAVAGAANFVRAYRVRVGDRETAEDRRVADALLADMTALLGTLGDNAGTYEVSGGAITFTDQDVAREYAAVRRRLAGRLASGSGSTVAATILRVLGRTAPPELM